MTDIQRDKESAISTPFRLLVMVAIALICTTGIWAATGRLDVVSVSLGEVVPASNVKQIQHLEGGIVSRILVEEGQTVEKGQPILELEPVRNKSELETIRQQRAALQADKLRFEAEIGGSAVLSVTAELEKSHPELTAQSRSLFQLRIDERDSEIKVLETRIKQLEATGAEVSARLSMNQRITGQVTEQIAISEKLLRQDLTNRMRHIELLRQLEEIKGKIATDQAMSVRVKHMIAEADASIEKIRTKFAAEAQGNLDTTLREITALSEQLVRYEDSLQRTVLRSPEAGIVKTLYTFSEGGVVKPGGTIADLVPVGDKLVIEAKLPIQDIGYVETGDTAQLRLASSDASHFAHLNGTVSKISPDTIITNQGVAFYKVLIEPEKSYFENKRERYQLYPGIRIQCSILIGERTVLDYFLSPLSDFSNNAMGER